MGKVSSYTILIGLHGRICHFLRYNACGWGTAEKAVLYQKCAYQMKVNFLPAVIGEIDDDNSEWETQGRWEHMRLQIALLYELSLHHFTPETWVGCCLGSFVALRLFIKSSYWIILALGSIGSVGMSNARATQGFECCEVMSANKSKSYHNFSF